MSPLIAAEVAGNGLVQARAMAWLIFNRYAQADRFYPAPSYATRLEGLLFADDQFETIKNLTKFWTDQGVTGEERANSAYNYYTTSPNSSVSGVSQVFAQVNRVYTSYNSGQPDPVDGAVFCQHNDSANTYSYIQGLQNWAAGAGRLEDLRVGFVPGQNNRDFVYNNIYSPPYPRG